MIPTCPIGCCPGAAVSVPAATLRNAAPRRPTGPTAPPRGAVLRFILLLAGIAALQAGTPARGAGIQGVSASLQPVVNTVRWDKNLGLEDTELFGGRLGCNFGRYISLQGYYLGRNNVRTQLSALALTDVFNARLADQDVDLASYGADLVLNLGTGPVVPFLRGGGGVMRLDPAAGRTIEQIGMTAGGGLRFGTERVQAELFLEDLAFRVDRYELAPGSLALYPIDPDRNRMKHNLSGGVGLNIQLGGYGNRGPNETDRAVSERFRRPLAGLTLALEPFVGTLEFANRLNLADQDLAGVRAGFDLGPYVGLRGYYWRGFDEEFEYAEPIESWGGEARFNLAAGSRITPYLVTGAGHLQTWDHGPINLYPAYPADDHAAGRGQVVPAGGSAPVGSRAVRFDKIYTGLYPPLDKTLLILGGGASIHLGSQFTIDVSARDYIFSGGELEDVYSTDQLSSNWLVSAGFGVNLFGSTERPPGRPAPGSQGGVQSPGAAPGGGPGTAPGATPGAAPAGQPAGAPDEGLGPPETWAPGQPANVPWTPGMPVTPETGAPPCPGAQPGAMPGAPGMPGMMPCPGGAPQPCGAQPHNYQSDRAVTIPVPLEGEIYIRYGPPRTGPGLPGMIREKRILREGKPGEEKVVIEGEPGAEAAPPAATEPPATEPPAAAAGVESAMEQQAKMLQEMEARINERMDRIENRLERREERAEEAPKAPEMPATPEPYREPYHWKPRGLSVYSGLNVDTPVQGLAGARLDLGPLTRNSGFTFAPNVAIGFGSGGMSYMITGNITHDFLALDERGSWSPFVGAGIGILGFTNDKPGRSKAEAVFNLSYGLAINLGRHTIYAEHQGVDLFDLNRILVGVRLNL